jgi:hypothetical protein
MKPNVLFLLPLTASIALAGPRTSANYSLQSDTVDLGGRRATSASYTHNASVGGIAGISTNAAPAEIAQHGYLAQLYVVTGLAVNAAAPSINESATLQLAAWRVLDDATFLATDATAVTWSIASGPLASMSAGGLATAGLVFGNTPATVSGTFGGFTGALNLTVLDTIPDNFGAYAGDGIGDDWQVQFFGENNPLAAPALDPDGDGQSNAFEFTAGLIPTDPASLFQLRIERMPGQPAQKIVTFHPSLPDRSYALEFRASLTAGGWQPLTGVNFTDTGDTRTVTDPNAGAASRFYRVMISKP